MIYFNEEKQYFHLCSGDVSYVIGIEREQWPVHLYWGKTIKDWHNGAPLSFDEFTFSPGPFGDDLRFSTDTLPLEYPSADAGDFRESLLGVEWEDGTRVCDLRYKDHRIVQGKPMPEGLPAVYTEDDSEAETLILRLEDEAGALEVELWYTVFAAHPAICRSAHYRNKGAAPFYLTGACSANVDFRENELDLITLWGGHNNERNWERRRIAHGTNEIGSIRGASSHNFSPFIALCRPETTEFSGDVWSMNFVYSGNFKAVAHASHNAAVRLSMGLNEQRFRWKMMPGDTFPVPETVLVYSADGFNGMSGTYHELYRTRLARGKWRDKERPVLLNNWEATYYDFNEETLCSLAQQGRELGVELFVLDDGWYGYRHNEHTSLGDWKPHREKFPDGMDSLVKRITDMGMRFGLWFEPEMVSVDSDLYRAHPDWVIAAPGRSPYYARGNGQMILDLSRNDVCDYIIQSLSDMLQNPSITYVKWDMNRHMTGVHSNALPADRQGEVSHRYILGLYHILETLTRRFPEVLFECCSGGGGRFDPGMLYYMPQTWTSDNSDAVCRLKIQYATSLMFPAISMGCHVSACPNHQVGRSTPLATRTTVAMSGNLGYELNITKLSDEEKQCIRRDIALYKQIRHTVQFGRFYRLLSPYAGNDTAWCFVSPDGSEVVAMYIKELTEPVPQTRLLRLAGLDADAQYRDTATSQVYGGDELMNSGIAVPYEKSDFTERLWIFRQC